MPKPNDEVQKQQERAAWLEMSHTQALRKHLETTYEDTKESWARGDFTVAGDPLATGFKNAEAAMITQTIRQIMLYIEG